MTYRSVRLFVAAGALLGMTLSVGAAPGGGSTSHSALVMPDGRVWTAGDNYNGEIGDGVVTTQPTLTRFNVLSGATSVAVGGNHTVALVGGAAHAWGHGTFGELCDGLAQTHRTPTPVPGISGAVQVAATSSSTFFRLNDGTIRSCGSNGDGVLGDGTTTLRTTPVAVVGLSDAIAIDGGVGHALALRANGTVVAWGTNSFGRLGDGTTTPRHTPVPVLGLSNVIAITAGQEFSMALDATGHVWVWGSGFGGINGDNTSTDHLTPYQVPGLANIVAIAAGSSHAVALDSNHQVWTWGLNSRGAIGDGIITSTRPVPTLIAGLTPIGAIVAGSQNTFAFAQDGGLYGWGDNSEGQLGDGTTVNRYSPTVLAEAGGIWRTATPQFSVSPSPPTYTADLTTLITSATSEATVRYTLSGADPVDTDPIVPAGGLLIDQNRTVKARAWKAGEAPSNVATATYTLQPALPVISPAGGAYTSPRTVTITTTTAGAVMRYTTNNTDPTASSPVYSSAIPIGTNTVLKAQAFRTGWDDSSIRTATYTFNYGTLDAPVISPGGGTYSTDQTIGLTLPNAPAGAALRYTLNGVDPSASAALYSGPITISSGMTLKVRGFHADWTQSAVASATYAFTAATPTFTQASGTHPAGQVVAIATSTPNATIRYTLNGVNPTANDPVFLPGTTLTLGDYTLKASAWRTGYTTSAVATATYQIEGDVTAAQIAAGDTHTLVVKRDGTIWGFGSNGYGYLGDNSTTARSLPVRAAGVTGIKDVAAGYQHSLAVGLDGRVYSFGTNTSGQQGDGATIGYRTVPWPVPAVTNAVAVAAGQNHSLALANTGEVYAWGANGSGQLGLGFASSTPSPTPTLIPGLSGIVGIAAGESHSLAWTASGALYAWGNNGNGRLGDNSTTHRTAPILITGISGVAEVAAGRYHTIARTTSGQVFTWGRNTQGQLGLGNTNERLVPTQVTALTDVQAIGAGHNHSLASTATTTYAWGQNTSSQVGDGLTSNRTSPYATSIGASVQVTGGSVHSVVLDASGAVWTWGGNGSGQLGNGGMPGATPSPISGEGQVFGASPPVANPSSGWYETERTVTLTSRTPGATIRYTTNDADPMPSDAEATAAIPIAVTTTLKARAWKTGLDPSPIRTFSYAIEPSTPTIEPNGGSFDTVKAARISIGTAAAIHYTTNGVDPQETDPIVASGGTVLVDRSMNLKVRAWKTGVGPGAVASAGFTLQAPPPTADPAGGTYGEPKTVVLRGATGTRVRFTLDGTDPSEASPEYQQPVTIWVPTTLKSRAFRTGWSPSATTTDVYDIQTSSPTAAMVARVSPAPNGAGWNNTPVTVSFLCDESISASGCPAPVVLSTEGANQIVAVSATTITGEVVTASATVHIDWTPPTVSLSEPVNGATTTSPQIFIAASVEDALAGLSGATCNLAPTTSLGGTISCDAALGKGRNALVLQASDRAGNTASTSAVIVRTGAVESISASPSKMTISVGGTGRLQLVNDQGAEVVDAQWSSNAESVAEVILSNGLAMVHGRSAGSATLVATQNGLSTTVAVSVVDLSVLAPDAPLLPLGSTLWSGPPWTGGFDSLVRANPVDGRGPELFVLEHQQDTSTLRALSGDGAELGRETIPPLSTDQMIGDVFGGLVRIENSRAVVTDTDVEHQSTIIRNGGGSAATWVYKGQNDLWSKVTQDFNGVLSAFEWNWQHSRVTRGGGRTVIELPGWLLRLDGRTGQVLSRIELPMSSHNWGGTTRFLVSPWVLGDPVVGTDGATYLLVVRGHQFYRSDRTLESAHHSLQLLRVMPDGTHSYRELAQGADPDGTYPVGWPEMLAVNGDGRLLGIALYDAGVPVWVIDADAVVTIPIDSLAGISHVVTGVDQTLIGTGSATAPAVTTSYDAVTFAARWSAPGSPVAPANGGGIVRDDVTGVLRIVRQDGSIEAAAPLSRADFLGGDTWYSSVSGYVAVAIGPEAEEPLLTVGSPSSYYSADAVSPAVKRGWFPRLRKAEALALDAALADLIRNLTVPGVADAAKVKVFDNIHITPEVPTPPVTVAGFRTFLANGTAQWYDGTKSTYCWRSLDAQPIDCEKHWEAEKRAKRLVKDEFYDIREPGLINVTGGMSEIRPAARAHPLRIFVNKNYIEDVRSNGVTQGNEAFIFHEALHPFTGLGDLDLLRAFGQQGEGPQILPSCVISEYIKKYVLTLTLLPGLLGWDLLGCSVSAQ
jgi:alpha-tubulin suppressor-like RCC1 family protein